MAASAVPMQLEGPANLPAAAQVFEHFGRSSQRESGHPTASNVTRTSADPGKTKYLATHSWMLYFLHMNHGAAAWTQSEETAARVLADRSTTVDRFMLFIP